MKPIPKVIVVGYGVIGKRIADAVLKQDDMKLVGVADISTDWRIKLAVKKGIKVFSVGSENLEKMKKSGINVEDTIENVMRNGAVDVAVDATPKDIGAKNKELLYKKYGVKAIFQGGEKANVADTSFVAQQNYSEALGKNFVRVVSCNTTAIARVVGALHRAMKIKKARIAIIRRAVDVWESHSTGIMNTVVPESSIPSHHGPDVQTVIRDLNITTIAFKGSHNLFHMHSGFLEFDRNVSKDEVIDVLQKEPRISFVSYADGIAGLNSVFELSRDLNRDRGDLYEVPVWRDLMRIDGNEAYLIWATANESIVIPENIDAIRAVMMLESDGKKSIEKTDKSLKIEKILY